MKNEPRRRKFWEYEDAHGSMTNFRVKWFIGSVFVSAVLFGALPASIGGIAMWWPMIFGGAALGAAGTLIAFTIDYMAERPRR